LQPFLDRILAAGFDGVYLDIIDAYWYWHETGGYDLAFTADKMVALVEQIGAYTRPGRPGFILCPQNGEAIIDAPVSGLRDRYFLVINAMGAESLFYDVFSPADQAYRLQLLRQYSQAGKNVFNIEYIDRTQWQQYLTQVCAAGFPLIPYAGAPDAMLDELIPDFPRKDCDRGKWGILLLLSD
jgi:cysteinyl-tRNA synthetase